MITGALLAAQVATGVAQAVAGGVKANRLERPEYKIPDAVEANMTMAQRMAFQGLPDEQKQEFIQQIDRQMSSSIQNMSDRKAGIGVISALSQQAQDSSMKLLSMDTQQRMANIQNLMNMRTQYAQYSDKQFMINEMQPYQEELQAAQQFQSAGLQNIMSGTGSIASMEMEGINPFEKRQQEEQNMFGLKLSNMFQSLMGGLEAGKQKSAFAEIQAADTGINSGISQFE